jgi:aryl-alcohol dehydrogenase-like predicted oxidoreductase
MRRSSPKFIVGARDELQLRENLGAIGWNLTPAQVAKLDSGSDLTPIYPIGTREASPSAILRQL